MSGRLVRDREALRTLQIEDAHRVAVEEPSLLLIGKAQLVEDA
jgi:hypothetical protein